MERERLTAIRLFADLPEAELDLVAGLARELELESGQPLAQESDFGHCIFAIESRTAVVRHGDEDLGSLGPGDLVGEIAVLAAGRRSATVVATSPMRVLSFFKRDVWALEGEAPEAARRLRELMATRQTGPHLSGSAAK